MDKNTRYSAFSFYFTVFIPLNYIYLWIMEEYILLVVGWAIYFSFHSILATNFVKKYVESISKSGFRFYRLIYSVFSTLGLLALLVANGFIQTSYFLNPFGLTRYLSLMLATLGVIVISRAFREYSFISFIGVKEESQQFKRSGILNKVRHPIYSGTILVVIGFLLFNPTIATFVSTCCIFFYLPIGIYLEEKKLILQFGDEYLTYMREVPSLIPKIKF
jgi:methanethiol S-methyltransferase